MSGDPLGMGSWRRAKYGCIVSFENAAGQRLVLHRSGARTRIDALRRACDDALALDPSFRVISYSTPETIYTDLSGGRADQLSTPRRDSLKATYTKARPTPLPELAVLTLARRRELLHPRLAMRTSAA